MIALLGGTRTGRPGGPVCEQRVVGLQREWDRQDGGRAPEALRESLPAREAAVEEEPGVARKDLPRTCWLVDREGIHPLAVGVVTLGRAADNDVVIENIVVSRRHCAIVVHADLVCELYDAGSKNGTFLNGKRLECPAVLASGDEIAVGSRRFLFLSTAGRFDPSLTLQD